MNSEKSGILLDLQYLPPVQWWAKSVSADKVLLEACEHYTKGSYRNRCHIAGAQGVLPLSIPLRSGKNSQKPIKEVRIADDAGWQAQHRTSIRSAYGKSPFYEFYADDIMPFFEKTYTFLWDWNIELIQCLVDLIGLDVTFEETKTYQKETGEDLLDFRGGVHPNPRKQIADPDFEPQAYQQVFTEKHGFLPNLSILDALFCKGPELILMLEA